jgi:hypothetical protein
MVARDIRQVSHVRFAADWRILAAAAPHRRVSRQLQIGFENCERNAIKLVWWRTRATIVHILSYRHL